MTDLIFDGNSVYARAWFAATKIVPDVDAAVRASLMTVMSLLNVHSDKIGEKADRLLFCWDGSHNPDKQREPKPPEYHETRKIVVDALSIILGAPHAETETDEADDLIATAVQRSEAENIYIVSGDKDLCQLQGGNIHYYCLNKKCVTPRSMILEKWGVKHPSQVSIALAIIGDRVDNIPGIHKWGPAKVKKLFEKVRTEMDFGEAFDVIDAQIPEEHKEAFYSSFMRTALNSNVEGVPSPGPLQFADPATVSGLGILDFDEYYGRVYRSYCGRRRVTAGKMDEDDY